METAETMKTTITIRKTFVIVAVVIGVIAASSQLFVETRPADIQNARKDNVAFRNDRDKTRDEILLFLETQIKENTLEKSANQRAKQLLTTYNIKAKKSDLAFSKLKSVKADHNIRGYLHLNAFLQGIGLPLYIFFTSLIIYIIGIFLKREKYSPVGNLVKIIARISFVTSLTYIYWALNPQAELHQAVYVVNLLFAAYFTSKLVVWVLKKNFFNIPYLKYDKLINALTRMVDYVILEVNEEFVSEEQKGDFVKSYDNKLDEISKTIE